MATYQFEAIFGHSAIIEVEADNYDEAYDMAYDNAMREWTVCTPAGWTETFMSIDLEDYDIPEEEED